MVCWFLVLLNSITFCPKFIRTSKSPLNLASSLYSHPINHCILAYLPYLYFSLNSSSHLFHIYCLGSGMTTAHWDNSNNSQHLTHLDRNWNFGVKSMAPADPTEWAQPSIPTCHLKGLITVKSREGRLTQSGHIWKKYIWVPFSNKAKSSKI